METLLCIVALGIIVFCYKAAKDVPIDKNTLIPKRKSSNNSLIEGMVLGEMISNNKQEDAKTELEQNQDHDLDSCESLDDLHDL